MQKNEKSNNSYNLRQRIGLVLGVTLFVLIAFLPIEIHSPEAKRTLAIAILMATWWVTEAIPIPAVSLLPLVLFPSLGIMDSASVA
ncbi:anion permease, partial [Candidatus Bipolaricaulota bacterium]|nr:anion permease [Candidatus Bipolaricaulota bacterium]